MRIFPHLFFLIKMKNKIKLICEYCKKEILDSENRVNYSETNPSMKKIFLNLYFHTDCWVKHYNESLDKKIKCYSKQIMSVTNPLLQKLIDGKIDSEDEEVFKI